MPNRCDRCRFFHPHLPAVKPDSIIWSADGIRGGGECRRHPPMGGEYEIARFPLVVGSAWCGEYAPTPTVPEKT